MKQCSRCGATKPEEEFNWKFRDRGVRDCWCKPCRSDYKKDHYRLNKAKYKANAAGRRRRLRLERTLWLIGYFEDHPCQDCGELDPVVLEFDHVGDKMFGVSTIFTSRKWETVLAEMAKCEVVCANCHRRRTARRGDFVRHRLTSNEQLELPL